jgi:hypothetical protein
MGLLTVRNPRRPQVAIHTALRGRTRAGVTAPLPASPGQVTLPVALLLLALAVFAGTVADFTGEVWPLIVLLVAPAVAWAPTVLASRSPAAARRPRRTAKPMTDRRPVLLRPVLVLPECRGNRIVRKRPRTLVMIDAAGRKRRLPPRRPSHLITGPAPS